MFNCIQIHFLPKFQGRRYFGDRETLSGPLFWSGEWPTWAGESQYRTFILFILTFTTKENILQNFMMILTLGTELAHLDHFCLG